MKEKIKINVEKTGTGFSAYAENYPAFTTGKNEEELIKNMVESLNLYFDDENEVEVNDIHLNYL